jgi:hypothetical protein
MEKLWLVEQDCSYLYGTYLMRAIVAADSGEQAKEAAIQSCATTDSYGEDDPICVFRDRLTAIELGPLATQLDRMIGYGDLPGTLVLARDHCTDDDGSQVDGDEQEYYEDDDEEDDEEDEEEEDNDGDNE